MKKFLLLFILIVTLSSCAVVKEYEKININDPDMALKSKSIDRFKTNFQVYREAAAGANGGKTGGGLETHGIGGVDQWFISPEGKKKVQDCCNFGFS